MISKWPPFGEPSEAPANRHPVLGALLKFGPFLLAVTLPFAWRSWQLSQHPPGAGLQGFKDGFKECKPLWGDVRTAAVARNEAESLAGLPPVELPIVGQHVSSAADLPDLDVPTTFAAAAAAAAAAATTQDTAQHATAAVANDLEGTLPPTGSGADEVTGGGTSGDGLEDKGPLLHLDAGPEAQQRVARVQTLQWAISYVRGSKSALFTCLDTADVPTQGDAATTVHGNDLLVSVLFGFMRERGVALPKHYHLDDSCVAHSQSDSNLQVEEMEECQERQRRLLAEQVVERLHELTGTRPHLEFGEDTRQYTVLPSADL